MISFAVINENNIVENIILWDGETIWSPCHESDIVLAIDGVGVDIGMVYSEENGFSYPSPLITE